MQIRRFRDFIITHESKKSIGFSYFQSMPAWTAAFAIVITSVKYDRFRFQCLNDTARLFELSLSFVAVILKYSDVT